MGTNVDPTGESDVQFGGTHGFAPPAELSFEAPEPVEEEPKGPDLAARLDGDAIPEEFRGLTLAEMLQRAKGQVEVIRKLAAPTSQPAPVTTQPQAQAATEPQPQLPSMTREQFQEMYDQDPVSALNAYGQVLAAHMEHNIMQRLGPVMSAGASTAEQMARQQYKEDFELFGDDIMRAVNAVPNRQALSNPQAWADVIAYVRGKNMDKIIERRIEQKIREMGTAAQPAAEADDSVTAALPPVIPRSGKSGGGGRLRSLSAEQKEVARVLGVTDEEYAKWYI